MVRFGDGQVNKRKQDRTAGVSYAVPASFLT
jgi:hypothetical protein